MKIKPGIRILIVAVTFTTFIVLTAAHLYQQKLQENILDSDLIEAVSRYDAAEVHHLVSIGAEGAATDAPNKSRTWKQVISDLYASFLGRHSNERSGTAALILAVTPHYQPGTQVLLIPEDDTRIVSDLLAHGAAIDATNNQHKTALLQAMYYELPDISQFLIDHGANVNISDATGRTPLMFANNAVLAQHLVMHHADVNATNSDKQTPLMTCISGEANNDKIVQILLDKGANPNAQEHNGWTPLFFAANWGNGRAIQLLLAHGANVNTVANDGTTALKIAIRNVDPVCIKLLKQAGAN